MFININSFGAGNKVLPDAQTLKVPPPPSDGVLEVLAVRNVLGGVGIVLGLMRPAYLASAQVSAFILHEGSFMELDGEPWRLDCGCDVLLEPHRKVAMLRAPKNAHWVGHL